ncbi:hypothetical protein MBLNU230_g4954t1 [Neophaeotheca triangularis]
MYVRRLTEASPATQLIVLIATLLPIYYISYQYRLIHPFGPPPVASSHPISTAEFIREWLDVHIGDPYNPSPLRTYCNQTEWHPNLVFNLDDANGGIGNVRGNILDFLFFAIEAGASVMLPNVAARSDEDISNVWGSGGKLPLSTYFDEEWLLTTMLDACPQMAIYPHEPGQQMAEALPGRYKPHSRRMDVDQGNTRKAYLEHLDAWLKATPQLRAHQPHSRLRRNFGQILRIKPEIRRLAAVAIHALSSSHNLAIDPIDPIPRKAFYGAHLRAENDAAAAGWLANPDANFTAQTTSYLSQATSHGLRTLYIASGNTTQISEFVTLASTNSPPLNLTTKHSLLPPSDLAILETLTWDQQALVDYEVLLRCSLFGGIVKSSFAYNLAMTRGLWVEDAGWVVEPFAVGEREVGVAFDDGVSRVLGRDEWHEMRIPRGMWP